MESVENSSSLSRVGKASDKSDEEKKVAGYKPVDLLKAPLSAPQPVETEPAEMTSNQKVKFLILIGVILFALGLLFLLVSVAASLVMFILAVLAIAISVFAPVK